MYFDFWSRAAGGTSAPMEDLKQVALLLYDIAKAETVNLQFKKHPT
jgi:hypothetical protein